jgi:hypothetical protein
LFSTPLFLVSALPLAGIAAMAVSVCATILLHQTANNGKHVYPNWKS